MAVRIDTDLQAVYIHEPLGHTVPALNTAWSVAGLYRLEADVNLDTLIVALYGTTAAANWVGLYMNSDGITCRLEGYNGGSPTVSGNYTLEVGRDYHLAIDYNGAGTVRMLLDGVPVLTLAFTPNAGTAGERSLQWGGYGEVSGYTDCTIARWRMWTAVLTEAEHRREHRSTVPIRTRNLIHDWPMDAGSGRFNDTIGSEPDLEDNPAEPCGDGTAFILRPTIIGTPQFFDLGETTTPGAQTINVPEWAERVVVQTYESDDAGTPDSTLSSLTSDFAGTFTIDAATAVSVAMATAVATADVLNWGAGRTITPVFAAVNTVAGAGMWVSFLQDVGGTFPTDTDKAQATGTGTTAGTASATGVADGLALAVDTRLDPATGNYPANESGWTSVATGQTTGTFTYWGSSRIRRKAITAGGTETATTQNTNGSCVSIATVAARALDTVAPTVALPVPGDVTASGSNTASTSWAVNFPDAVLGDMFTVNLAWDDSTTVTSVTPPTGPNGETATAIVSAVASNGTEVRAQAWRYIATGTWAAGTRNFTPSASESWQAHVLRVRAGEFDATTPIGATSTRASAGTAETSMLSPAFSAGSTDGGGRLVMYGAADDDPVTSNASGWSTLATADLGAVTGTLAVRNLETTASESMPEARWRIASDSWATLAYVIRKPSTSTDGTATGQTLTAAASLIPGSASGVRSPTQAGVTLTAAASLIAGLATGQTNITANGVLVSSAASLIPGAASGVQNPTAAGQTMVAAASLVPGAASGVQNPTAAGQVLTAAASLIAGAASSGTSGTADGVTMVAAASLVAGSASGVRNATAPGATMTAGASLVAGAASAVRSPTQAGATLSVAASLVPGAASGVRSPTAAGVTLSAAASLVAGAASADNGAVAPGALFTAGASLLPGAASAVRNAEAFGAFLELLTTFLPGDALTVRVPDGYDELSIADPVVHLSIASTVMQLSIAESRAALSIASPETYLSIAE